MHTNNPSPRADALLKEAVEHTEKTGNLESHLPESVTSLDKAALLAVLYRLVSAI